jgi:hypothetical protein
MGRSWQSSTVKYSPTEAGAPVAPLRSRVRTQERSGGSAYSTPSATKPLPRRLMDATRTEPVAGVDCRSHPAPVAGDQKSRALVVSPENGTARVAGFARARPAGARVTASE